MKDKKKQNKKGGFYIALCSCAVVVAMVSYVGDLMSKREEAEQQELAMEEFEMVIPDEPEEESYDDEYEVVVLEPEPEQKPEPEPEPVVETAKKEIVEEFLPAMPAPGKILAEFSSTPVFYEKLDDWRNHNGIDIEAAVGDDVYICESGVVEKIRKNSFGGSILVDHKNGYKSVYSNLDQVDLVMVGDELNTGETIGRVGEASLGDLSTVPHVHFELYYNGKAIDPLSKITVD